MSRRPGLRTNLIATAMVAVALSAFVKADRAGRRQGRPARPVVVSGPIKVFL